MDEPEARTQPCDYPKCVENEDERCPRWLTGECGGPSTAAQPTPCAGMSCGTTTAQHSRECIAEHAAADAVAKSLAATHTAQPATQAGASERCQHCIDRQDGFYGSWAPACPVHNDDGTPRVALKAAPTTEQPGDAERLQNQPLSPAIVEALAVAAGYFELGTRADFINGMRWAERAHGIDAARAAHGKGGQG